MDRLSYSGFNSFWNYPQEFALRYLMPVPVPRTKTTKPMCIGTGFDAWVKFHLNKDLDLGLDHLTYELQTTNIPDDLRIWTEQEGHGLFKLYKEQGAYGDLLTLLEGADAVIMEEHFERLLDLGEGRSIKLHGYPDLVFLKWDRWFVIDWKVNGFCSKWGVSPAPGFWRSRPSDKHHKTYSKGMVGDFEFNDAKCFSNWHKDWPTQLLFYHWMVNQKPLDRLYVGVEQLACSPKGIRSVSHRGALSPHFELEVKEKLIKFLTAIEKDHIFTDLTLEQSQEKMQELTSMAEAFGPAEWLVMGRG